MDAPHSFLQHSLLWIFPRLAAFDGADFPTRNGSCFYDCILKYLNKLVIGEKVDKAVREHAFVAMGMFALAMMHTTNENKKKRLKRDDLRTTLAQIKASFPDPRESASGGSASKKAKSAKEAAERESSLPAIFSSVSLLARAKGNSLKPDVAEMLDSMLLVGLTPALTTTLHQLAIHIPAFKSEIADGLLRMLSLILMQRPLTHPGTPKRLLPPPLNPAAIGEQNGTGGIGIGGIPETDLVVLGLRTLGTFDFEGQSLLQFVRHCADTYLHSEETVIRLEAVKTCSLLLKGTLANNSSKKSPTITSTISEVLRKLLTVGITDKDAGVRSCVISSLDVTDFDMHMAQADSLASLMIALNDEVFEIRELAVCIIGRLADLNPAYIMPSLRCSLLQMLTEMEFSGIGRNKQQSAIMLGYLVANAPRLIRPYVRPILNVLMPKLRESTADLNPSVTTSVLRAIGDLAAVGGDIIADSKADKELLSLLLEILNDASSTHKREVCVWTLAQLVENTGSVVKPYEDYPYLLDMLLGFLRTEQRGALRSQTLRLLGLLGALDPYKHKMNMGQADSDTVKGVTAPPLIPMTEGLDFENDSTLTPTDLLVNMPPGSSLDEFYPSVAILSLMKIIKDPNLSQHHTEVVQATTYIFRALGIKSVPYIPQVIPSMLTVIRTTDPKFYDSLLRHLGDLIGIVRQHVRNHLVDIFALIRDFWSKAPDSPLQLTLISLVETLALALGSEFKAHLPNIIAHMLRVLAFDGSKDRTVTLALLKAFRKFSSSLGDHLHLLLPKIVCLFDSGEVSLNITKTALECVDRFSDDLNLADYASLIIHPLVRCLDKTPDLRNTAMDTLASLVGQLGKKFNIFVPLVQKVLQKHKIVHQKYDVLCARALEGGSFEDVRAQRRKIRMDHHDPASLADPSTTPRASGGYKHSSRLNMANLQKAWTVSRRISKDDWLDWYSRLCSEMLKASPSPALRACWTVAQRHSQLAKDLFNASFISCWTELTANQQDELMESLEHALKHSELPEIAQTVLNLAEFMEHCSDDKGLLPIDPLTLGKEAFNVRAYAKALHYQEDQFKRTKGDAQSLELLIATNNKLGQKEAAAGLLEWGRKNLVQREGMQIMQERWYEKLHDWDRALEEYKRKSALNPDDSELILGQMRCLEVSSK